MSTNAWNGQSDDDLVPSERPDIDAAVAGYLDHGIPLDEAALDRSGRLRAADGLLMNSLLEQSLRTNAVARERRIVRVCTAVENLANEVTVPPPTVPRRRNWMAPLTVAAAVVIAVAFLRIPLNPRQTALAAVNASLRTAGEGTDRKYLITTQLVLPNGDEHALQADLWVRGNAHYVLRQDGALGDFVMGSDGNEHWVTPAIGPVFVGNSPSPLEQLVLGEGRIATPFLQLTTTLERMAQRYELSLLPEENLPDDDLGATIRCAHVLGRKKNAADLISPDTIELWTARQSGLAHRLALNWATVNAQQSLRRVTFELQSLTEPVADDWYRHGSHHAPDRMVIQRGPESRP